MVSPGRAFRYKIFPGTPVRRGGIPEFFYPCDLIPAGKERSVMDFTQETGNCRSIGFGQMEMRTDIFHGEPLFGPAGVFHVLLQQFGNFRMTGHGRPAISKKTMEYPYLHFGPWPQGGSSSFADPQQQELPNFFGDVQASLWLGPPGICSWVSPQAQVCRVADLLSVWVFCVLLDAGCVFSGMYSPTVRLPYDNYSYAHKSFKPLQPDNAGRDLSWLHLFFLPLYCRKEKAHPLP